MHSLSLHQPWASLCVTRQPCDCNMDSEHPNVARCASLSMVKRFETRSWPCPPALIGQRIALHATKAFPDYARRWMADHDAVLHTFGWCFADDVNLPLGVIVGSAVIEACYPIKPTRWPRNGKIIDTPGGPDADEVLHVVDLNDLGYVDISDQLPYGDFTPDRYAWLLADAAPTTERCPWCWGSGRGQEHPNYVDAPPCRVCRADLTMDFAPGRCEPIPARGRQRIWNWTP